jgi:hypothetical protein
MGAEHFGDCSVTGPRRLSLRSITEDPPAKDSVLKSQSKPRSHDIRSACERPKQRSERPCPPRRCLYNIIIDDGSDHVLRCCGLARGHEAFSDGLLFHDLVHVEQYRQLGIPGFSEFYVREFLDGGSYEAVPQLSSNCEVVELPSEANAGTSDWA